MVLPTTTFGTKAEKKMVKELAKARLRNTETANLRLRGARKGRKFAIFCRIEGSRQVQRVSHANSVQAWCGSSRSVNYSVGGYTVELPIALAGGWGRTIASIIMLVGQL